MPFYNVTVSAVLRIETEDKDIAERMGHDYMTEYMMYEQEEAGKGNYTKNFPEEPLPKMLRSLAPVVEEVDPNEL